MGRHALNQRLGRHERAGRGGPRARSLRDVAGRPDSIRWEIGPLGRAYGDPFMLRLVIENLLSNASNTPAAGAEAVIEVGRLPPRDGEAVFFVRDNGVGFDMAYVDKLFGVFQRLHRVEEFEGTGIGLANVRRIVERHGGRTWAEGELGRARPSPSPCRCAEEGH